MARFLPLIAIALLGSCNLQGTSSPTTSEPVEPMGCPSLPASSGYSVNTRSGPDFVLCDIQPLVSGNLPATLYIGNFPPDVDALHFVAFTPSTQGNLAWFAVQSGSVQDRTWLTYVSTGNPRSAVMVISVHAPDRRMFLSQAENLSETLIGASIAP